MSIAFKENQKTENKNIIEKNMGNASHTLPHVQPHVNIYHNENNIYIAVNLPSVDESSIDISVHGNTLEVIAKSKIEQMQNYQLMYSEYQNKNYSRTFKIDERFAVDTIEANYKNGILLITAPLKKTEVRKIKVKK